MILTILLICFIIAFKHREILLRIYKLNRSAQKIMTEIPSLPSIPLLGSTYLFKWSVKGMTYQMEEWGRKLMMEDPEGSGGLLGIWVGPIPVIVAGLHESIQPILESSVQITKPSQYDILQRWLGEGLAIKTGERWHSRRKLLTPAFHFNILKSYIPVFGEQGEILCSILNEHADTDTIVDVFPLLKRCGVDIITETAMGVRLGTQTNEESSYIRAIYRLSQIAWDHQRFPWLWLKPLWFLSGYANEFNYHQKLALDFTRNVIAQRREILEEEGLLDHDVTEAQVRNKKLALLDLLLMMQKANALTDEDLRSEVDTFMFEGSDTNSSNMGFCLWWIGQMPEVQARVHAEVDEVFGSSDRAPTEEDLCRLSYIERCVKESLRMMSPVPMIARRMVEDMRIGSHVIPEGITILITPPAAHHDPRCWERPEEFYPDHFLPEKQAARDPFTYIPFSAGPRNCIGQKFAMMEAKSIIAQIFRKFRVETIDCHPENRPLPEIILKPSNGFRVRLYRR